MDEYLTPSGRRAMEAAAQCAKRLGASHVEPAHLLLAVAEQEESRGATILASHGITCQRLREALQLGKLAEVDDGPTEPPPMSEIVRQTLSRVRSRSIERGADNPAGTDVILLELLQSSSDICSLLGQQAIDVRFLKGQLEREFMTDSQPLATAESLNLDIADATDVLDVYRILDAAANRAREGLRVLEDYARFACDDPFLTGELKAIRHEFRESLDRLPRHDLLASRDTERDVGTTLSTPAEWSRSHPLDVVLANFKRTQEAMRSLEEFGKTESRPMAEAIEALRYRLYTLERATMIGADSRARLDGVVLYVLVTSDLCQGGLEWTVKETLAGGAQMIQLREKSIPDRELTALAHSVRRWTRDAGALFIMNDRPDIARLVEADGVHVGQEDLSVKDARRIIGPRGLVGVSAHSIEQARQAVLDGANYIGVGPTFPSQTKSFDTFPGRDLIRQVHSEIRLPAFAIGGIALDRLEDVLGAGIGRVAISAAICSAEDPRWASAEIRRRLQA